MNFNIDDKKKQIVILAIALALGGIATVLVGQYIVGEINKKTELLAREFKAKSDEEKRQMNQKFQEIITKTEERINKAVEEVKKAAPPREEKKEEKSPPVQPLSTKMPPGKRAITVSIDPLSAVGGLVNPGDFVDVIIELKIPNPQKPENDKDSVTTLVFQNVQVLAVGTQVRPVANQKELDERFKSKTLDVALAVSPDEAGLLTFAQANGKIILSLRSPNEKGLEKVGIANWNSLSEFVEKNQGAKIMSPEKPKTEEKKADEAKPTVQIFKSGIEY